MYSWRKEDKKTFQTAFMINLKQKSSLHQSSYLNRQIQEAAFHIWTIKLCLFSNNFLRFWPNLQPRCFYKRGSNKKYVYTASILPLRNGLDMKDVCRGVGFWQVAQKAIGLPLIHIFIAHCTSILSIFRMFLFKG